jgi:phosphoribosylformimino-5-aminoimidazole carboxamide ribotide isomerase
LKLRPCIDIHNGKVKQIVGSSLRDGADPVTNFVADQPPSYFAGIYRDDNLSGGHVIMLGSGNERVAIDALQAFPGGLQAGGGITPANAKDYIAAGASHVIVTSWVFSDGKLHWDRLEQISRAVGNDRLVLDLSCRKEGTDYVIVTDRWQRTTDVILTPELFEQLSGYCDEFLVHAAHVEGKQAGIDADLVALLADCSVRPVTYAGGVRSFDDLEEVAAAGNNRVDVTIGSALSLFGGALDYHDVVAWFYARRKSKEERKPQE